MKIREPIDVKEVLMDNLRTQRRKGYRIPKIGVYYPTILVRPCLRDQWNFYMMAMKEGKFPDSFLLYTEEGNDWHKKLERLHWQGKRVWDSVEKSVVYRHKLGNGRSIVIRGRCDVIRGDTVYDFKRTGRVPWGYKPKFEHMLQVNFYMSALGLPKGVVVYIGLNGNEGLDIVEKVVPYSDWHITHLVNRAVSLHGFLEHGDPPSCSCRNRFHEKQWRDYVSENKRLARNTKRMLRIMKK